MHPEHHRLTRSSWLRAVVLGANDGIISTASLVMGVAAAESSDGAIWIAGVAAAVAGSLSMGAGEYVSVSTQADIERADLELEKKALAEHPLEELEELAAIYEERGVSPETAREVAEQLMAHDALGAHARDEIGIFEETRANPLQAALSSALSFMLGAALPLLALLLSPRPWVLAAVPATSLLFLAGLGVFSSKLGGAPLFRGAFRVAFWGAVAMFLTWAIGHLFGISVG